MFAALNTFRHKLISDFKLESFELSQAHTFFWDKYEKSNWFLEQIIATADQEIGSRKVKFLLDTPQQDGGQWDMVVSLFEKYGVVPKSVYPESVASSNSRELNQYLNKLLRQDAQILRDLIAGGADQAAVQAKKEELLQEIFNYLAMTLVYHHVSLILPTEIKMTTINLRKISHHKLSLKDMWVLNLVIMCQLSTLQQLINLTENLILLRCWVML